MKHQLETEEIELKYSPNLTDNKSKKTNKKTCIYDWSNSKGILYVKELHENLSLSMGWYDGEGGGGCGRGGVPLSYLSNETFKQTTIPEIRISNTYFESLNIFKHK